jgi:hypothetical protein
MTERINKTNSERSRASPDRSSSEGDNTNTQKRKSGETPRDKPVEEEADKDVKNGGRS